MRNCLRCDSEIPQNKRRGAIYCSPYCKKAWWDEKNREKRRSKNAQNTRRWRHGITNEQYLEMLQDQNNSCLICLRNLKDDDGCIDHCHSTGKIRGVLCNLCNLGLGFFQDDPERMIRAASYLDC